MSATPIHTAHSGATSERRERVRNSMLEAEEPIRETLAFAYVLETFIYHVIDNTDFGKRDGVMSDDDCGALLRLIEQVRRSAKRTHSIYHGEEME